MLTQPPLTFVSHDRLFGANAKLTISDHMGLTELYSIYVLTLFSSASPSSRSLNCKTFMFSLCSQLCHRVLAH